jgi:hypothetical protein
MSNKFRIGFAPEVYRDWLSGYSVDVLQATVLMSFPEFPQARRRKFGIAPSQPSSTFITVL